MKKKFFPRTSERIKIADIGFSLIDEKILMSIAEKIVQKTVDKA